MLFYYEYAFFFWIIQGGAAKPQEKKEETAESKPVKFNPFGAAKPRDENEYIKKKKVEGVAEGFEEIKELKAAEIEKIPVKVEEKPKVVVQEKKQEEEFIVANKVNIGDLIDL